MKKIAIIGASGYSGEELVRLLLNHPHAELTAVTSRQYAGQTLAQVFRKFAGHPGSKTLRFTDPNAERLAKQADVVFLALPHGVAAEYAVPLLQAGCAVIDLSADFRIIPRPICLRKPSTVCRKSTAPRFAKPRSSPRPAVTRPASCCRSCRC
jgi:N-acetyl-gamma-glutamylphosphate reductase